MWRDARAERCASLRKVAAGMEKKSRVFEKADAADAVI